MRDPFARCIVSFKLDPQLEPPFAAAWLVIEFRNGLIPIGGKQSAEAGMHASATLVANPFASY